MLVWSPGGTPADLFKLPAAENVSQIAKSPVPGFTAVTSIR